MLCNVKLTVRRCTPRQTPSHADQPLLYFHQPTNNNAMVEHKLCPKHTLLTQGCEEHHAAGVLVCTYVAAKLLC